MDLSCSEACGVFPDRGSNPCLPHRLADSLSPSTREAQTLAFSVISSQECGNKEERSHARGALNFLLESAPSFSLNLLQVIHALVIVDLLDSTVSLNIASSMPYT